MAGGLSAIGFIFLLFSSDFTFVKYEIRGLGAEPPTSILYNFRAAENCTKVRKWVPTCDACYSLFPVGNRGFYAPGTSAFAALMPRPPYRRYGSRIKDTGKQMRKSHLESVANIDAKNPHRGGADVGKKLLLLWEAIK
jgi:hypothetical protein